MLGFGHFNIGMPAGSPANKPKDALPDDAAKGQTTQTQAHQPPASTSLPPPSPLVLPSSVTSSSTAVAPPHVPNTRLSPGRAAVDSLVHKLSKQNLQLDRHTSVQPQLPSESADLSHLPDVPTLQPWSGLEVDDEPQAPCAFPMRPTPGGSQQWIPSRIEVDDNDDTDMADIAKPDLSQFRSLHRKVSLLSVKPISMRVADPRVEEMIARGAQCNVNCGPPPTPTSSSKLASILEPDPDFSPPNGALEVDEAYCNGHADMLSDELAIVDNLMSLRRAGTLGGIRKQMVAGIPLRYQLSADAALRCQTVVRSRPRMRKRKNRANDHRTNANSIASSAVTSAISSPVIPPSIPSPHIDAYP
ncbi:hypothetical protein B0T17DRAFT_50805 [Bombardia bombarda]|uniref:Uncharacterized protein n=1 Tax=Bombardia bombarda TaxID=252184 RepID=A0AA40CFN8_9PEZI|nr:hypothetical protein B0T17DRAFT_50805 [Bombardia bombarda]